MSRSKMSRLVASAEMNNVRSHEGRCLASGKAVARGASCQPGELHTWSVRRCPHSTLSVDGKLYSFPHEEHAQGERPCQAGVCLRCSPGPPVLVSPGRNGPHSARPSTPSSCSAVQHRLTTEPHISRPVRVHADALVMPGTPVLGRMWSRLSMCFQAGVHLRRGTDSQVKAPSEHPTIPIQMRHARHHCTHGRSLSWPTQLPTKLHGFNKRTQWERETYLAV